MSLLRLCLLSGMIALPVSLWTGMSIAETLEEAYIDAYTSNPALDAQRAALRATDEGVSQALSGWRPTVTLNTSYGVQEQDTGFTSQTTTPLSTQLTVSQPIYTGGRVTNQRRQADAQVQSGRSALLSIEQDTLLATVTAYVNVQRDEKVVSLNENNVNVLRRQLRASKDRFDVGEATKTDVAQSRARVARAVSDLTQSQAQLTNSWANYERVIGHLPGILQAPPPLVDLPGTLEDANKTAQIENPLITSALHAESAAHAGIGVAKSGLYPRVSIEGNYSYLTDTTGPQRDTDTASLLGRLTVPLYQGGVVYSQIRQAEQIRSQRRREIADARRRVLESVTQAWAALTAARATNVSNKAQVTANLVALDGVQQELLVGSRTQLDVLDAEQELLNSKVSLVRSQRDEYVAAHQLRTSMGRMTVQALGIPVTVYDPRVNYRRVRDKWFGGYSTLFGSHSN